MKLYPLTAFPKGICVSPRLFSGTLQLSPMKRPAGVSRPSSSAFTAWSASFTGLLMGRDAWILHSTSLNAQDAPLPFRLPPFPPPSGRHGRRSSSSCVAAWQIATIIGLLRLRNWARYSVLVLGRPATLFGLFCTLRLIFSARPPARASWPRRPTWQSSTPGRSPPHLMQVGLPGPGTFLHSPVTAIGIWWLVYFNRARSSSTSCPRATRATRTPYSTAAAWPHIRRTGVPGSPSTAAGRALHPRPWPILTIAVLLRDRRACPVSGAVLDSPSRALHGHAALLTLESSHADLLPCRLAVWASARRGAWCAWTTAHAWALYALYSLSYALLNFVGDAADPVRPGARYQAYQPPVAAQLDAPAGHALRRTSSTSRQRRSSC